MSDSSEKTLDLGRVIQTPKPKTVFVDGIPSDITDVRKYFGQFGKVAATDMRKGKKGSGVL